MLVFYCRRFFVLSKISNYIRKNYILRCQQRKIKDLCSNFFTPTQSVIEPKQFESLSKSFFRCITTQIQPLVNGVEPSEESDLDKALQKLRNNIVNGEKLVEKDIINLICECGQQKRIQHAEQVFLLARKVGAQSPPVYAALLKVYGKHHLFEKAMDLFDSMKMANIKPEAEVYTALISIYGQERNEDKLLNVLQQMKEENVPLTEKTYIALIEAYIHMNKLPQAEDFIHEMELQGYTPSADIFSKMVEASAKINRVDDAASMMKTMLKNKMPISSQLYNSLIIACGRTKNHSLAFSKFKEMSKYGLKPDVSTWNALIECYCLSDKLPEARTLLSNMQKELVPNAETYAPLIRAYVKQKNIAEALSLFDELTKQRIEPNHRVYRSMIEGLIRNKQIDKAYELVDAMLLKNVKPDNVLRHILYSYSRKQNKMEMFESRFGKVYSTTATMRALEASRSLSEQTSMQTSSPLAKTEALTVSPWTRISREINKLENDTVGESSRHLYDILS
jgi:pentatricopeptide repeat protein